MRYSFTPQTITISNYIYVAESNKKIVLYNYKFAVITASNLSQTVTFINNKTIEKMLLKANKYEAGLFQNVKVHLQWRLLLSTNLTCIFVPFYICTLMYIFF